MLRRAALLALFTFTPLGAYVADVELAAVRTARQKARERKRKKAERKRRAAGQAAGGARRATLSATSLQHKRRKRRGKRRKKQPAQAPGPWLAFGLSVLATAAAGLFVFMRRRSTTTRMATGSVEGTRIPKLTDPYDRQDGT